MAPKVQTFGAEHLKKFESCLPPHNWPSCRSTSNLSTPKNAIAHWNFQPHTAIQQAIGSCKS
eukprot:10546061-Ditylum_brightwellii.AAC.1